MSDETLMEAPNTRTLSILIQRDADLWVAQCIEHDLATQAPTLDTLHLKIQLMFMAHIASCKLQGTTPFKGKPAPPEFRAIFENTNLVVTFLSYTRLPGLPRADCRINA